MAQFNLDILDPPAEDMPPEVEVESAELNDAPPPEAPDEPVETLTVPEEESAELELLPAEEEQPEPEPQSRAQQRIQQEIARRKELEEKLEANREQVARMEARFEALQEQLKPQPTPEPEPLIPEFDEDPGAHLLAKQQQLEAQLKAQQESQAQQEQLTKQQAAMQHLATKFVQEEQTFAKENPAYWQAAEFLKESRQKQYQALGYSPEESMNIINWEVQSQLANLAQRGISAPEAFFQAAQAAGFRAEQAVPTGQSGQPNIQELQENVGRTRSLGPSGKAAKNFSEMSFAEIANLDEEDYEKFEAAGGWDMLRKRMQ